MQSISCERCNRKRTREGRREKLTVVRCHVQVVIEAEHIGKWKGGRVLFIARATREREKGFQQSLTTDFTGEKWCVLSLHLWM